MTTTTSEIVHKTESEQERIEAFMRTHVGRYVLPGKLAAAEAKGAATVSVPTADMVRLLARVGFTLAPVQAEDAPTYPDTLASAVAGIVALMEWDSEGFTIVSREQVQALADQAARLGLAAPRPVKRRTPSATLPEIVNRASTEGKRNVTVPVGDLARMLDTVEQQREANRPHYAPADYVVAFEHIGDRYRIDVPPSMTRERREAVAADLRSQIDTGRVSRWTGTGFVGGAFRWMRVVTHEEAAA